MNHTIERDDRPAFQQGDRVRVLSPHWEDGSRANDNIAVGTVGIVSHGPDSSGDYFITTDGREGAGGYVGASNLELAEKPAGTTLATATVNVEVRFFIAGTDVTDRIKTLFA